MDSLPPVNLDCSTFNVLCFTNRIRVSNEDLRMTIYSKLKEIAANVFDQIAIVATRAADRLDPYQHQNDMDGNQRGTVYESVEWQGRPAHVEDIIDPVHQHFYGNNRPNQIVTSEILPEIPSSLSRAQNGGIPFSINQSKSTNGRQTPEKQFTQLHHHDRINNGLDPFPTTGTSNKTNTELAQLDQHGIQLMKNIDCSFDEQLRRSNIDPPKKKRKILRFNNLSRMRTFRNGAELQTNYPEQLVLTFPSNGGSQQCNSLNSSQADYCKMEKRGCATTVPEVQASNANLVQKKRKTVRFNDISRMLKFKKHDSIQPSFEEHLVSTFHTGKTLGKRKCYTSLQDR